MERRSSPELAPMLCIPPMYGKMTRLISVAEFRFVTLSFIPM